MSNSAAKIARQLFKDVRARHQAGELDAAISLYRRALEYDRQYTST